MTTHNELLEGIKNDADIHAAIQSIKHEISKHNAVIDGNYPSLNFMENRERKQKADKARSDLLKAIDALAKLEQLQADNKTQVSITLVIENQAAISTVQAEIDRYQGLIDDHQRIINISSNKDDLTSSLMGQREQLLTNIALGYDKASSLKKINDQLQAAKKEQAETLANNQNIIDDAQQTITGINRLVMSSREKLAYLHTVHLKIVDALLMEQAEQTAIEFNELAQELFRKLMHLSALGLLVSKLDQGSQDSSLFHWFDIKIPTINSAKPPIDFNSVRYAVNSLDSLNGIKQNLIEQGVNVDIAGI